MNPRSHLQRVPPLPLALAAITLLGLGLRIHGLGSDLWIDEIVTLDGSRGLSIGELYRVYGSPNQHLLKTLLIRASVGLFGESEWTVRLPAMLFGAATVPAMYWVARMTTGPGRSLAAALLLAVSYHHVWFSQSARGYSAYLLFSLLATGALCRALSDGRARWGLLYVVAMALDFASFALSGFLLLAHGVAVAVELLHRRARGEPSGGLTRRLGVMLGGAALSVPLIYAPTLRQLFTVLGASYVRERARRPQPFLFSPLSFAFLRELARGISEGFGGLLWVAVVPFAGLAAFGLVRLLRRARLVVLSLALAVALIVVAAEARHWVVSPRFLLLALPLALLVVVEGIWGVGEGIARRARSSARHRITGWTTAAVTGALTVVSLLSLRPYYATPKQPYRAAIRALEELAGPEDAVVAISTADRGFNYYIPRVGPGTRGRYYAVRTDTALLALQAQLAGRRMFLATTFPRAFSVQTPALYARVTEGWRPVLTLPATLRSGEITLWAPRADPPPPHAES
jgi:hypothetical protein